jgi:GxxExxY protein
MEALYPHSDITEKIINAVYEVYNRLGPGFIESVYEKALVIALRKRDLKVEQQKIYRITYDGQVIGEHRIDLLVEDKVIVEIKAIRGEILDLYQAQLISYLKLTNLLVGLLINFGNYEIRIRRIQNKHEVDKLHKDFIER